MSGRNELNVGYFSVWDSVWFAAPNGMKEKRINKKSNQVVVWMSAWFVLRKTRILCIVIVIRFPLNAFNKHFTCNAALLNLTALNS